MILTAEGKIFMNPSLKERMDAVCWKICKVDNFKLRLQYILKNVITSRLKIKHSRIQIEP